MSKRLVAYFSCTGTTAKVAETLAESIGADIFEIEPAVPYTAADLDWRDNTSRSSVEMNDPHSRPAVASKRDNMADYETILVGFPIWWYVAPTIINFATSGGSGMEQVNSHLAPSCVGAKLLFGKVFPASVSKDETNTWFSKLQARLE